MQRIVIVILFALSLIVGVAQNRTINTDNYDAFTLAVNVQAVDLKNINAIYDDNQEILYLPVIELFDYLKINIDKTQANSLISGFLLTERNKYTINTQANTVTVNNQTQTLSNIDLINKDGVVYLSKSALESLFGLKFDFNFRSLSAKLDADFELPIVRQIKLENARNNLKKLTGETNYDQEIGREYHAMRLGMLDWSLYNAHGIYSETRLGLAGGIELLGGEADVWLNYSSIYKLNRTQQRYLWRWVNNDSKALRQLQLGRIYSNSIASLLFPVDGAMLTNARTGVRRALGDYLVADYTEPNWLVELYVNNVLIDYANADASGYFSFKVPIVYGSTNVTMRFYGPNGEERAKEKVLHMPFNFLPSGEFEYKVAGGMVLDSVGSRYAKADMAFGITRGITINAGVEYSETILGNNPYIPFAGLSLQPFPRMILVAEYAHDVRMKAQMNYTTRNYTTFELNYIKYEKDQTAVIFNYLEERLAGISVPYRFGLLSGYMKGQYRQNLYSNFGFNTAELMFNGYYRKFNFNLNNYYSQISNGNPNVYSHLGVAYKFPANLTLRSSIQYSFTGNYVMAVKAELEKQVLRNGHFRFGYENNYFLNSNSFNVSFRYDFSSLSAFASTFFSNRRAQFAQGARGSFAFGGGNKYTHTDAQNSVGRSAIAIIPYVDTNHNNEHDEGEPLADKLNVRNNGGKVIVRDEDNIVRIVGLEPFIDYNLIFDENGFDNLAWRIENKNIKVTTDPNQFKKIKFPVKPMAEVFGTVVDEEDNGIGRILLNIFDEKDSVIQTIQTEPDGYFSYLGLVPGAYKVAIDTTQLSILKLEADDFQFKVKPLAEGDIINTGKITLKSTNDEQFIVTIPIDTIAKTVKPSDTLSITVYDEKRQISFDYRILFDFDKFNIRSDNYPFLLELVSVLKKYPCLTIRIEAHTDSDGSRAYNQLLSERRARSVKDFIVKHGIEANRLTTKGYGEDKPLNNNSTRAEKALNRRATFVNTAPDDCAPDIEFIFERFKTIPYEKDAMTIYRIIENPNNPILRTVVLTGSAGAFYLQVGAFSLEANAQRLATAIDKLGMEQKAVLYEEGGMFKVRVSKFASVKEAQDAANKILYGIFKY